MMKAGLDIAEFEPGETQQEEGSVRLEFRRKARGVGDLRYT